MADIDDLERALLTDLRQLGEQLRDEELGGDLYRALTNNVWRREGGPEGHLSVSWRRAEDLVNELRAEVDRPPLTLAQTGREGEVSPAAEAVLDAAGWRSEPLDTGSHDDAHDTSLPDPPPARQGERLRGEDTEAEDRAAHEAAERERERTIRVNAPGSSGAGG